MLVHGDGGMVTSAMRLGTATDEFRQWDLRLYSPLCLGRLNATTTVLQRARLADPLCGMWEAADVQWWWRRPRASDELVLPVWFDEVGPVAAAGVTAWDDTWQADVFAVPSIVDEEDVWAVAHERAHKGRVDALRDIDVQELAHILRLLLFVAT